MFDGGTVGFDSRRLDEGVGTWIDRLREGVWVCGREGVRDGARVGVRDIGDGDGDDGCETGAVRRRRFFGRSGVTVGTMADTIKVGEDGRKGCGVYP